MADANPFAAYVQSDNTPPVPTDTNPFAQYVAGAEPDTSKRSLISDIGSETKNAFNESIQAINTGLNPFSMEYAKAHPPAVDWEAQKRDMATTGAGILGIPGAVMSPITGAARALVGTGMSTALGAVQPLANAAGAPQQYTPDQLYEMTKGEGDKALMALGARGGLGPRPIGAPPTALPEVLLSRGQETGDLGLVRKEQAAATGQLGESSAERATQFSAQQAQQVEGVRNRIAQSFDQFGQTVAATPQEAADIAQKGLQQAKQVAKDDVTAQYQAARGLGGSVDGGHIQDASAAIRDSLTNRPDPVIVDDKLTPWASKALSEIDSAAEFKGPANNAALSSPAPGANVANVSLEAVDQVRKRLVALRRGAWANNETDGRAASAVLDAFDDHIAQGVSGPAAQAWNDARSAAANVKTAFSPSGAVGKQLDKIIGPRNGAPLIPNDVADAIYGRSGTNPNSTNVGLAARVRNILGDNSPEWSAVKQGLFQRLTERADGQTEMGPGKVADRISQFLNGDGREMANSVFSPAERVAIQRYGDLMRKLEIPKTGSNPSGTSTFVGPMLNRIGRGMSYLMGYMIARHVGLGEAGELAGAAISGKGSEMLNDFRNARMIRNQMPLVSEAVDKFQKATAAFNKANSPPSRVALTVATSNLARSLKPLGITLDGLLPPTGAIPAGANQQQ